MRSDSALPPGRPDRQPSVSGRRAVAGGPALPGRNQRAGHQGSRRPRRGPPHPVGLRGHPRHPLSPSAAPSRASPVASSPDPHPAIAEALIEWDWRLQDGIQTPREPRTYRQAIEKLLRQTDALVAERSRVEDPGSGGTGRLGERSRARPVPPTMLPLARPGGSKSIVCAGESCSAIRCSSPLLCSLSNMCRPS